MNSQADCLVLLYIIRTNMTKRDDIFHERK